MEFETLKGILSDDELNFLEYGKEIVEKMNIVDDKRMIATSTEVVREILIVANNLDFETLKEVLSEDQLSFLEKIQEDNDKGMIATSSEVMQKILIVANNYCLIMKHLKKVRSARTEFIRNHLRWKEKRRETIQKLKEIGNAINKDILNCNIAKRASAATSIAGGGLMLASAILVPFTGGLSTPLIIAGGSLLATGSATNIGTSVTKRIRIRAKLDEAENIIIEDKVLCEKMVNSLEHSEKLYKALFELLEIDILEDIISSVSKLVDEGMKIQNTQERKRYIEKNIICLIKSIKKSMIIPVIGIKTLIPLLIGISLLMKNRECQILLDSGKLTVRALTSTVVVLTDVLTDVDCGIESLNDFTNAAALGASATIGLTLNVANIVVSAIGIHKGSFSSYAQKVLKVANEMEKEAEVLEKFYHNLVNSAAHLRA